MKTAIILLTILGVAYCNLLDIHDLSKWKTLMPTVTPNKQGLLFKEIVKPPTKNHRVTGTTKVENCGTASVDSKIVFGQAASPGEFPWQAAVYIDNQYFCGGSLISPDWVLTAAHCTTGASSIRVVLGAQDLSVAEASQVEIFSSNIITHEDYGSVLLKNDVGLVQLSSSAPTNARISPVCLPSSTDPDLGAGETVVASGWGKTSDASGSISDTLNKASMPVMSNADCLAYYGNVVTDATICTDSTNGGTCNGDSGGPLNYLTGGTYCSRGVTSFVSSAGCESGGPDGFTRTKYYLDWITTNTGIITN